VQSIGPDKVNQLRHIEFFKDLSGVLVHMEKHASILRPKFEKALEIFAEGLPPTNAQWTRPDGGYFISVETPANCAKRVYQLCKEAGVEITEAGASFPYGQDPQDTNLRFAPSFLSMDELNQAAHVLCCAISIAALEKLLELKKH